MSGRGGIVVGGVVAWYAVAGYEDVVALPAVWRAVLVKRLKVQGFLIFDHADSHADFLAEVGPLVKSGAIFYRESVAEGLAAAPQAFIDMLQGGNFGKQLVRVAP